MRDGKDQLCVVRIKAFWGQRYIVLMRIITSFCLVSTSYKRINHWRYNLSHFRSEGGYSHLHLSHRPSKHVLRSTSSWGYCGPSYGSCSERKVSRVSVDRYTEIHVLHEPNVDLLVYTLAVYCFGDMLLKRFSS